MPITRYDRVFAHVASMTGLLSASQVEQLFGMVDAGEARDMATAAHRSGVLSGDLAAAVAIIADEIARRRIAEDLEPDLIVAQGRSESRESLEDDAPVYPRTLGNYTNLKQVARGAMGLIFRGESRIDGAVVALKVLPLHMVRDEREIERFQREIETITSLVHPNIVRVYDYGREDDYYYYAMEYLDGRSLRELIHDRGRLSPYHAAEIIRDAARGLAYAHRHGVIHRDVKPSNVMIGRDGQVKLVDFGLAFQKTAAVLTASGVSLGTPAYMSPEQIEGSRAELDERSDIYSLGVTLFEAVSGERPFEGDNQYDVMRKVLFDPVPVAHEVNPMVPRELSDVIARAIVRNPAERWADMGRMIEALDRVLEEPGA